MSPLAKVADFQKRWPQLKCTFELTDHVISNPNKVLLKEIGLEPIE